MSEPSRMPGLALPFLLVGAVAGWLTAGFLANPFIAVIEGGDQALAAGVAAIVAAVVGVVIARRCRHEGPFDSPYLVWIRLAQAVVLGGAVTGGIVGGVELLTPKVVFAGAVNGAIAGVFFLPVCGLVLDAARRADRARHGSLVAGSDHRAVWGILATALAVTTVVAALDWVLVGRAFFGDVAAPTVALGALGACGLLIGGLLLADLGALRRVDVEGLEAREGEGDAVAGAPRLDLGLGEGVLAQLARGQAVYRSRERAVALVVGDPVEAREALRRAVARGWLGLGLVAGAGAAHLLVFHFRDALYRGQTAMVPSLGRAIAYFMANH